MTPIRPKPHREFFRVPLDAPPPGDLRWQPVPGHEGWITELILADNLDAATRTGSRTRLARWAPGTRLARPVRHDFHEEVFLLSGDLVVGCDAEGRAGERFEAYTFACRPPGVWHGPFASREGCVMLEFQYYDSQPAPVRSSDGEVTSTPEFDSARSTKTRDQVRQELDDYVNSGQRDRDRGETQIGG